MITLEWPWIWLALPLPYLIYRFFPAAEKSTQAIVAPFFARVAPFADTTQHKATPRLPIAILGLIWLLFLTACARPLWVGDSIGLPSSGRDLLVAVDISESMETQDMLVNGQYLNRVTVVKRVVSDFISRRSSDRIGLVLFGTQAYLQTPLTFDQQTVARFLEDARLGFAGNRTAIGDAIGLSVKRLQDRPQDSRVVILLTDGANNAGEIPPLQAAELASQANVKIYTIGLGADEMLVRGWMGNQRVNPSSDLDEDVLKAIASKTGGRYFRARDTQQLADIYQQLDALEPVEQQQQQHRPQRSLFMWPLGIALLLSILLWLALHGRTQFYALKHSLTTTKKGASHD